MPKRYPEDTLPFPAMATGRVTIEVRATARGALLARVTRTPRQHAGWQSVRWHGQEYQLFRSVRGGYFIDTSNRPLRPGRFVGRMIA